MYNRNSNNLCNNNSMKHMLVIRLLARRLPSIPYLISTLFLFNFSPSALNIDSLVFFEIYHASKQSFLYLKEFYIGELAEEDRELVVVANDEGQ